MQHKWKLKTGVIERNVTEKRSVEKTLKSFKLFLQMASQDVFFKNLASFWLILPSFSVTMPASLPQFQVKSAHKQSQILFEEKV